MTEPHEYRLLQVFLSRETGGVSEVSFREIQKPHFLCTCPDFTPDDNCDHIGIVLHRMRTYGHYPFPRVEPALLAKALEGDAASFRAFVLEHAVVDLI